MPLVINSLGGGHTHKHTQTIHTGSILRNQARAWFNNFIRVHPLAYYMCLCRNVVI